MPYSRKRLTGLLLLGLLAACAKVAPPPGGDSDREAPSIVRDSLRPSPGAAGVAPQDTVTIVFSERPNERSVMRALTVIPSVDFEEVAWQEDTLRLVPDPAWAAQRNTLIRIGTGAEDRRGNPLASVFQFHFTTKTKPDSGEIVGRVWGGNEWDPAHGILLLAMDAADTLDLELLRPHAMVQAARDGAFRLLGLDTARAWRIAAIIDRNDDLRADDRGEVLQISEETIRFELPEREATVTDFLVGTLDTLGTITGETLADSAGIVFVAASDDNGTVVGREGPLHGGGAFEIVVPTGHSYELMAFLDEDGDSTWADPEVMVKREGGVSLKFVAEDLGLRFDLRTPEATEDLEIPGTREALGEVADEDSTTTTGDTTATSVEDPSASSDSTGTGERK